MHVPQAKDRGYSVAEMEFSLSLDEFTQRYGNMIK